ncbi:hypothetical protein [Aestuariispira insulae]|uniref:Uncharacterized protein n=1 Tax=Aestuariispira insulae TaxID=1461337 RepID=A0A3D9HVU0_9PROT|nr:hypothetical protein [Aestuariispira insulae]RED53501.1 hypothetical protein DFP90_101291 [Aestuariispira insulae]
MTSLQKTIIAATLTLFFLYHAVTDTAAGHGLMPMNAENALLTNLSYTVPVFLSLIWLLRSLRELAHDRAKK